MLVSYFTGAPAAPVVDIERCGWSSGAEYQIRIVRCITTLDDHGDPPQASAITADAELTADDIYAIRRHLIREYHTGRLLGRRELYVGPALPADPEGGLGGWTITVQVEV